MLLSSSKRHLMDLGERTENVVRSSKRELHTWGCQYAFMLDRSHPDSEDKPGVSAKPLSTFEFSTTVPCPCPPFLSYILLTNVYRSPCTQSLRHCLCLNILTSPFNMVAGSPIMDLPHAQRQIASFSLKSESNNKKSGMHRQDASP